jgi:BirA family biotin operon repressor/biotin-[acetyl-CoA-carboxylase] ligase
VTGPAALRAALAALGLEWPESVEWHASVGSTNDVLRERARAGAPAWTAVGADHQSAGRGRQGRTWLSEGDNLYLSVLLRPEPADAAAALLPLVAGIAVGDAVASWGVEARLKWPNDLVAGERKLGGTLAEATSSGGGLDHVVLGIGVNLAARPAGLEAIATSVKDEGGRVPAATEAAAAVLGSLRRRFAELRAARPEAIVALWRARSVDWWGRRIEVTSGDVRIAGRALGVDTDGALLVATGSGTMRVLSGDARALRLSGAETEETG